MDDTISRKAVIDGLWKLDVETRPSWLDAVMTMVNELPSAQICDQTSVEEDAAMIKNILRKTPLILTVEENMITCQQCKHRDETQYTNSGKSLCKLHGCFMYYCSDAERE